jgi:Uma2 family endonuclease
MYDLPSENPEEPGLPDEFHDLQPQLLSATFRLPDFDRSQVFTGSDLNLYYDSTQTQWYKRPDWFGVVGVPRLYKGTDLRLSYVIWKENVSPAVVVELLSPGTEKEDLGQTEPKPGAPPTKWQVYEQILKVPYYLLYDRYTNTLRAFILSSDRYQELGLMEPRVWLPELKLGIGLWEGIFEGVPGVWLRWYDSDGNWILTETEQERQRADQEQQAREAAERRAEALARRLRELGLEP